MKSNSMTMDDFIVDDEVSSNYTRSVWSTGSRGAAQAPTNPGDEVEFVKSNLDLDIWETHRPTIKRLYLDEDKFLKDVIAIMQRDYDHKATVKMYKDHITKWGLDKNCKANEMKAIARKKVERDAMGKASVFQIRGRQIEIEEVLRFFKRKRYQSLEEVVVRDESPEADTPSDVRCLTPGALILQRSTNSAHTRSASTTTIADKEPIHIQTSSPQIIRSDRRKTDTPVSSSDVARRQLLWMNDDLRRLSFFNHVSSSLTPPRDLLIPELILSAIKTLFQGFLDGGFWKIDSDGYLAPQKGAVEPKSGRYAIWDFQDCCEAATSLLEQKLFVEARQLLSKACEKIKDVLEEGHARTIPIMFDIYFRLEHVGYGDAAIKVFEHLRSMAVLTPHCTRTFCQLIENMLLLDQKVEEVYFLAWKCSEDIFEQHLEPFNRTWLASRLDYIERMSSRGSWWEAERLLRSLSMGCEQNCGKSDPRCWEILASLAWNLYYQGRYEEAEELGQYIVQQAKNSKQENIFFRWTIRALNVVSAAQYSQFKNSLAQDSLGHCIDMATKVYGGKDSRTIRYSLRLEKWLLGWGRPEEAVVLAAQRSQLLGPPEIEELND